MENPPPQHPDFTVERFGLEREPVVIIDNFLGETETLTAIARQARYAPVDGFPGIRCRISSTYMAPRLETLRKVLAEVFDLPGGAKVESCHFSIVSKRPDELSQGQRRPHYDASDPFLIAMLHYMGGEETGGTSFYRHRRTGLEAIHSEQEAEFLRAVTADEEEFGQLPPRYFFGDDERYEMIGTVEAKRDRVVMYRGRILHSGHIPMSPDPETALQNGRLTVNTFLVGQA